MNEPNAKTVTQDNALVSACYKMGLDEKRLLVAAIAKLDPTSKAWLAGRAEVEIGAQEWADLYGVSRSGAYSQLSKASKELYNASVRLYGDSKKGKDVRWISAREWAEGAGYVRITFSGPILHYLSGMVDEFTKYDLLGVSNLKSVHSVRLYELAAQFKRTGWRQVNLDDLRAMMGLEGRYPDWRDLRKVIEKSSKEISQKSDLSVEWEPVNYGRRVIGIKLKIAERDQLDLPLGDPQKTPLTRKPRTPQSDRAAISASIMDIKDTDW